MFLLSQAGETALYLAAQWGHEECVQALLEAGCDVNIVTAVSQLLLHSLQQELTDTVTKIKTK